MVGAVDEIAGYTLLADWRLPSAAPPKDRDFALGLGPLLVSSDVLTPDGLEVVVRVDGNDRAHARFEGFDWERARDLAAARTVLKPGDLLVGPALAHIEGIAPGSSVELQFDGIGALTQSIVGD
jgi:2-keto-4-pentenoate hydratase/2-oxohepta-3-ene-1,7-dioic acid hydratase in catechol pathway